MKNIVACNFDYFTLGKDILVMKDGNTEHVKCENIDNLPKMIYNICIEKEINDIVLSGSEEYGDMILRGIKRLEIETYNCNKLNIKII